MQRNKGNPKETPTQNVAATGIHKFEILSLFPSHKTNTTNTIAETITSNPKNAPILVEKSSCIRSGTLSPFSRTQGINCVIGTIIPAKHNNKKGWIQQRSATLQFLDFTSRGVKKPNFFLGLLFKASSTT
jgi:hypothetical protein